MPWKAKAQTRVCVREGVSSGLKEWKRGTGNSEIQQGLDKTRASFGNGPVAIKTLIGSRGKFSLLPSHPFHPGSLYFLVSTLC